jgi:hypothetical protein
VKPSIRLFLVAALFAGVAQAADKKPSRADVAPPPGMNDPGVTTTDAAPAKGDTPMTEPAPEDPLAPLPKPDARLVRDKASRDASSTSQRIAESEVTRRQQGNDTVEEYRDHGHVWMIKIVPQSGPSQTFMDTDGSGRLSHSAGDGPIAPVYYTLYEWK